MTQPFGTNWHGIVRSSPHELHASAQLLHSGRAAMRCTSLSASALSFCCCPSSSSSSCLPRRRASGCCLTAVADDGGAHAGRAHVASRWLSQQARQTTSSHPLPAQFSTAATAQLQQSPSPHAPHRETRQAWPRKLAQTEHRSPANWLRRHARQPTGDAMRKHSEH